MPSQIRWRLTITYLLIIFAAMSVLGVLLSYSIERQFVSEVRMALNGHGDLVQSRIEEAYRPGMQAGDLDAVCRVLGNSIHARVIVLDKHGVVLGDSETSMAAPEDIPESMRGLQQGFGCRICHSEVRRPGTQVVSRSFTYRGTEAGTIKLSTSLYQAKRTAGKARRIIVVTLILTSLIAAGVTMRLASSIAGPISRMNRMATRMASGDLNQRVEVESRDEVGQLAESLNMMADNLQANLDQLAEETGKMQTILSSMADGIIVTDRNGVITLFNRSAERLLGFSPEHIIGKPIEALSSVPQVVEIVRSTLSSGRQVKKEVRISSPAERILDSSAGCVRNQKGEIVGSVLDLQDVTEVRRQAEIRKDFVANVSHELRTPVASIRAIVGALQSGGIEDPSVAEKFINSLDAEAERLSLLLNDLLNLSELESGKLLPRRTVVSLRELADEAVSGLAERAKQCGVQLSVRVPSDLRAYVDRRQMLQVFQNLIDNAIKYTPEGGSVDITGAQTATEVSVTVKDTGVGIAPADLDRIFERFYRVDKARSRQLGGTGLGLSIVKDIVDAHDGRITVESQVGVGSSFTVILPNEISEDARSAEG